jgi:surface antigen
MKSGLTKLALAVVLAATGSLALAQNWRGTFKDSPAGRFNEEDVRIFSDTSRKALDDGLDNETLRWNNPKTGSRGEVTVLKSFDWKTHRCREVQVHNEADGRKETSLQNFCSIDGQWRLVSPPDR